MSDSKYTQQRRVNQEKIRIETAKKHQEVIEFLMNEYKDKIIDSYVAGDRYFNTQISEEIYKKISGYSTVEGEMRKMFLGMGLLIDSVRFNTDIRFGQPVTYEFEVNFRG